MSVLAGVVLFDWTMGVTSDIKNSPNDFDDFGILVLMKAFPSNVINETSGSASGGVIHTSKGEV